MKPTAIFAAGVLLGPARAPAAAAVLLLATTALAAPPAAATALATTAPAAAVPLTTAAPAPAPPPGPGAPLADAVERKDLPAAHALIGHTDVNAASPDGMTALHWAAYHDDVATAKLLIAAGANVRARNRYGVTPLSLACTNGEAALVELLLAAGADPNAPLPGGETPLMTAARTGRLGPVKALLARHAEVNARLPGGQTALMWAAAEGHSAVVQALLAAGADFRSPLPSGFSPMLFAVRGGHTGVVRLLREAGVDIKEAARTESNVRKLLRNGASALTTAIENAHFELAAWLLDLGADPNDMRSGYTPLHILSWIRKPDRGEDDGDPVPEGSGKLRSEQLIGKLIAKGADVNARLKDGPSGSGRIARKGATPLMLAADTADTAYLRILVAAGADHRITNVDGCTPLMAAAGLGTRTADEEAGTVDEAVEAVSYLLSLGANIDAVAGTGDTAMHGAAFANFPKVVKLLAAKGAKIDVWNRKNKRGWTPLLIAEGHRYGNFKPSFETIAAIKEVMLTAGVTPPPPTPPVPAGSTAEVSRSAGVGPAAVRK
jgi:ankyrin repeat protein